MKSSEMTDEDRNSTNELRFSNEMDLDEEENELLTGATEEVEEMQSGPLSLFKDSGFDTVKNENDLDHLMIHDLYQPLEMEDGQFTCKICRQVCPESAPIFTNKNQFASHRYRYHGTFMNLLQCPDVECEQQFSSIIALKKHLQCERNLPIESHYKHFSTFSEFEIWRSTVEQVTGSRYVLHNKQSQSKRNVMHCFRSEHKMSGSKNRNRSFRMRKPGSVCPAHITFIENQNGSVDAVYQLFHFGHDEDASRLVNGTSREDFYSQREEQIGINTIFPVSNRLPKSAAMQYVQLCLVDMPEALYLSCRYSQLLVVLDVQSYFIFARPIPSMVSVSDNVQKSHIIRQLVDMFTQFGCPVGFSVCASSGILFESMESMEEIFNVNMIHVGNVSPDLSFLKKSVIDRTIDELGVEDRWPEVVPFVVYSHNSEGGGEKYLSPFEMMFGRRPPHLMDQNELMDEAVKTREESVMAIQFEEGDAVLVRYFDPEIIAEGPIRNASEPQPSREYLNGIIGEVNWYGSPFYPYKVFVCRSTEQPNEDCPFLWVSPFDVAPTVGDIRNTRNIQRRNVAASFLCECRDESSGEKCILPRAELCAHKMSRVCCEKIDGMCEYHNEYNNGGGDSYKRVEGLSKRFTVRDKYAKDIRREEKEQGVKEGMILREVEKVEKSEERIVGVQIEGESNSSFHLQSPVKRRKGNEDDELPSTSQSLPTTIHKFVIAEKKPVIRRMKRKGDDEFKEEGEQINISSPIKKKDCIASSSSLGEFPSGESSKSIEESIGDRRKSGRISRPNILYKSYAHH